MLTEQGESLWTKALPNGEAQLVEVFNRLQEHGRLPVVVDQSAPIGASAIAVGQHLGVPVAHLLGLTMRGIVEFYPGDGKTDGKGACIVAGIVSGLPLT